MVSAGAVSLIAKQQRRNADAQNECKPQTAISVSVIGKIIDAAHIIVLPTC